MAAAADSGLCEFCRELKPVSWTDEVGRDYCAECLTELTSLTTPTLLDYLAATVPFAVGDRVEARTAGALFDGIGVIDNISMSLEHFGTPVYPAFHVKIIEKAYDEAPDELWYTESCLQRVEEPSK